MDTKLIKDLQNALETGLGIVTRIWDYRTKDWVTGVFAFDIDGDGQVEIIATSRDGRVHLLSQEGDLLWKRIIGTKASVGTVAAGNPSAGDILSSALITVGSQDGKVYMLDKDGKTVSKDGDKFSYNEDDGKAFNPDNEQEAYWLDTGYAIRQVFVDSHQPSGLLISSEDRCAYGLDYETGKQLWMFQTNGWVRSISACDIDGDGQNEILVASTDQHVYLLDQQGQLLNKYALDYHIYSVLATDIDHDGRIELLITTEGKELVALVYHKNEDHSRSYFDKVWVKTFPTRLISFCVADIDGDGHDEIITGSDDNYISILDAQGNTIWRHNHKYRVLSMIPCDIDNNGLPELLIGTEDNRVRAMRIRLRQGVESKVRRYYYLLDKPDPATITGLTIDQRTLLQNILNLKTRELVTFEQAKVQMEDCAYDRALVTLLKLEQQHVELLWYKDAVGHIRSISFQHLPTEHKQEIIIGTAHGTISAFNVHGRHTRVTSLNEHIVDVQTGIIDHHKQEKIVAGSAYDRLYILSGARKRKLDNITLKDSSMSSIYITTATEYSPAAIIIGSEKKKVTIYGGDLQAPIRTISTKEGVRMVRAQVPTEGREPEIVTANLGTSVSAYSWYGKNLWHYSTRGHIKSLCIKDINNDGKIETLVGSEDRNIHVLDNSGHLLWRYILPHSILAINAMDTDNDGKVEVFVGCADAYLYVFSADGDLLWTYQMKDRIRAVGIADIDGDNNIEIALGSEDELELLRMVNTRQIQNLTAQCWSALCEQSTPKQVLVTLLNSSDPLLQGFALSKLAEQKDCTPADFVGLEKFANGSSIEVSKALVHVIMLLYPLDPSRARTLLSQLWRDSEQEVRNTFLEHIQLLLNQDLELAFIYLKRAAENPDRFVRRLAIRKIYQLIDTSGEREQDGHQEIFRLLLALVQDKESEWIRQEAARVLGHFLDWHHESLVTYTHLFIVKGVYVPILRQIAHATNTPIVKNFINAITQMIDGLDGENASERLLHVVRVLESGENLTYGKDLFLIYTELYHLFSLKTIDEIANYQYTLKANQFDAKNKFAFLILEVFTTLSHISHPLKKYSLRESVQDRLDSLLEALEAIDPMPAYLKQKFATPLMGEPITRLPNHRIFLLLLENWRKLVQTQLNDLRGKAELKAELQSKTAHDDEQVSFWLSVKNTGRSSANTVRITFYHGKDFEIVGKNIFETEIILPGEEKTAEFTISPCGKLLNLEFEMTYNDTDGKMKIEEVKECLELTEPSQEFRQIPNLYSTGTPTHDSKMFYGRRKEMAFLLDNLTRSAKSVVVLYGQRRSGKTTMLLQLSNSSHRGNYIPVLIDLQGISYYMAIDTLLYEMARSISEAMEQEGIVFSSPRLADIAANPLHTFNLFLNDAVKHLAGRKLILLIDEFEVLDDQVVKGRLRPEIFEYLRDIVQYQQSINFLFSGTHKITDYTKWYRSVFFHIARHYRLSRLSSEGAEDLIKKPVEGFLEYDPLAVKKIRQLTADQPYLLHLICRAIVDHCNEREKAFVTINDVNTVLSAVMETSQHHFDWLWDQINPEQHMVLAIIAEGGKDEGRWLSLTQIEEMYDHSHVSYKDERILKELKTLIDADIIEDSESDTTKSRFDSHMFRIPVGLTRTWLLKEHPVELVRKEMVD